MTDGKYVYYSVASDSSASQNAASNLSTFKDSETPSISSNPTSISQNSSYLSVGPRHKRCRICSDMPATHIAVPCGHYIYCENCIQCISECTICGDSIEKMIKVLYD